MFGRMFSMGGVPYTCENDDCPWVGRVQHVPSGQTADCVRCGWSMRAAGEVGGEG